MSKNLSNYDKHLRFNKDTSFKVGALPQAWVKDAEKGFIKGDIQNKEGSDLKLKMGDGSLRTIAEKDTLPANPSKFDGVKDCAELSNLNEAAVLHNLRVRYDDDLIHTYSGLFLVVVNPYNWLPLYTDEIISMYSGKRRADVHPHIYAVADEAYRAMLRNKLNQSILITGESGAGKTENTKKVIQYLATVAGKANQGGKLEDQILQANPMLEAFGNAKTNKNDNSSRFGKFIRIQFNAGGVICGATVQTYLLEKSRVVHQGPGERSFHIFYQLPLGATAEEQSRYKVSPTAEWGFRSDTSANKVNGMDDVKEFEHTRHAMQVVGLDKEEMDAVFRVMAGIMHCGNIKYGSAYGSDGANIESGDVLDTIASLWKVDRVKFERSLIRPRINAGREIVEKHLNVEQAQYSRNAMCKAVYERAFLWIVKKLNTVLAADREANFIGCLDIAGFEIFQNNSFEQLCINFTNEKLQEFFNHHMFKLEQEEYAKEQIVWTYIDFGIDSKQTIDLIEKKPNSIMSFLDEESIFPKATDETLIQKLHTLATKNPKYGKVQFKKLNFSIQHYAGDVVYDVTDWITKNKDPLQEDIATAIRTSSDSFISNLFTDADLDARERLALLKAAKAAGTTGTGRSRGGGGASTGPAQPSASGASSSKGGGASFMTVGTTYREQLDDLMGTLRATEPNFIRCLIPNLKKERKNINAALVLEQLACNGVLEGIRISRKGFPNRITYPEFVKRYYLLHPTIRRNEAETKDATMTIMKTNSDSIEGYFPTVSKEGEEARERPLYQFGTTKIFFRHGVLAWLEQQREAKIGQMVIAIQNASRGWVARSAYKKIGLQTAAARTVQKNVKSWIAFKEWGWWKLLTAAKQSGALVRVDYDAIIKELEGKEIALQSELEKTNKEITGLKKDLDETKSSIATLESELDSANKRLATLTSEHGKLSNDNDGLQAQIEGLESKLNVLSKERSALEADFKDTDSQLRETSQRLADVSARRKGLDEDKKQNESKIAASSASLDSLETEQSTLKKRLAALEDELNSTSKDRDGVSDKASQLQKQVLQLQAELDEVNDDLDAGKKERSKLEAQRKDLENQLKSLQADVDSETSSLTNAKSQQASLQGDVDSLTATVDEVGRKAADVSKTVKKLEGDLTEANAELEESKNARSSAEKKAKALQQQRDELESRARSLEAENQRLDATKRETNATLEDLNRDIDALSSSVTKLQSSIKASDADLTRVTAEVEKAESDRDNLAKQKKKLEQDLKDAEGELDAESAKASTLSKNKSKLDGDIKSAEDSVADLESKKAALASENKRLKADLTDAEGQLDDLESKKADLDRQLKALQKDLEDAKATLDEETDARARADKAKKAAEAQLQDARADVTDLEAANRSLEEQIKKKSAEAAELAGKGDSAALAEAKSKWTEATKKLVLELKEARDRLADAEEANRGYERDLKNLDDSLMSEKERSDLLAKEGGSRANKETDSKLRALRDEADATKAKSNQVRAELAAATKELEQLRSIISADVSRKGSRR